MVYSQATSSSILALATAEQSHQTVTVAPSVVLHLRISLFFFFFPSFCNEDLKTFESKVNILTFQQLTPHYNTSVTLVPRRWRRRLKRSAAARTAIHPPSGGPLRSAVPVRPARPGPQRRCDGRSPSLIRWHRADTSVGHQRGPRSD